MSQGFTQPFPIPLPVNKGGTGTTTSTGTGSVVLSNSPSLVTPALGTPSSVVLTHGTGLPMATGVTGGGMVLLGTGAASNSSSISFTGISGALYSELVIVIEGVLAATSSGTVLLMNISTGSGFLITQYSNAGFRWVYNGSAAEGNLSTTSAYITAIGEPLGITVNSNEVNGVVRIYSADVTVPLKMYDASTFYNALSASGVAVSYKGRVLTQSQVIDGVSFTMSAGNIASGTFHLYGLKNS